MTHLRSAEWVVAPIPDHGFPTDALEAAAAKVQEAGS